MNDPYLTKGKKMDKKYAASEQAMAANR